MNKPTDSVLDLIGNTPMLKLTGFETGVCELYLKLEGENPGGSIKDRVGLSIIGEAERSGELKPGGTIVEATAGNTGIGLAIVAAQKGYPIVLVIPDKMSRDKIFHLEGLGAKIILTRSDVGVDHPDYYQNLAKKIVKEIPGAFLANQFANPANPLAHKTSTAPEIWEQMEGRVDAVVAGVGSGGTITGLGQFFKEKNPEIKVIVADPVGSVVADAVNTGSYKYTGGSWFVEGIGEDFIPPNLDLDLIDEAITISEKEAFSCLMQLLTREGVLAGSSTGTLLAGALKWCRAQTIPKRVVTFACDTGNKYLSKAFNRSWLLDNELIERKRENDLSDLITFRADRGEVIGVSPTDTLLVAYNRMRASDISQLPVLENGKLVGVVDESDLLIAVHNDHKKFQSPLSAVMTTELETLEVDANEQELLRIFSEDKVAIITRDGEFLGFVTKVDLMNRYRIELTNLRPL